MGLNPTKTYYLYLSSIAISSSNKLYFSSLLVIVGSRGNKVSHPCEANDLISVFTNTRNDDKHKNTLITLMPNEICQHIEDLCVLLREV